MLPILPSPPSPPGRPRVPARPLPLRAAGALLALTTAAIGSPVAASPPRTSFSAPGGDVAAPSDVPWVWPVGGARTIVEPYRAPEHRYGAGHRGMDLTAAGVVVAPAAGIVAFAGRIADRGVLTIDHGDGYVITLEPVASTLVPGDAVGAGTPIGEVASGGHAPGGALHVGVRLDGEYLNPLPLFGAVPRAILYPCCEGAP